METEKLFKELKLNCANFDWTFPFSDDPRVYSNGEKSQKKLKNLIEQCEKIDPEKTKEIVKKYQRQYGIVFYKD